MRKTRILFALAGTFIVLAIAVPSAVGHWFYFGSDPAHIHVRVHWFLNEVNQSSNAQSNTREAQIEWHQDARLDLSSTSSHDAARFTSSTVVTGHRLGWDRGVLLPLRSPPHPAESLL